MYVSLNLNGNIGLDYHPCFFDLINSYWNVFIFASDVYGVSILFAIWNTQKNSRQTPKVSISKLQKPFCFIVVASTPPGGLSQKYLLHVQKKVWREVMVYDLSVDHRDWDLPPVVQEHFFLPLWNKLRECVEYLKQVLLIRKTWIHFLVIICLILCYSFAKQT